MSRLKQLGIDEDAFSWSVLGICNGSDLGPTDFYEKYEASSEHAKLIDQMCLACPVIKACAENGLSGREDGVWGAIFWDGTGKPSRVHNSHKSPEVWESIARKIGQ